MAKYKHTKETKVVLDDLKNRLTQLIESLDGWTDKAAKDNQVMALQSARMLVQQCIDTGHTFRGSDFVPDGLEGYYQTEFKGERLGVGI